MSDCFINGVKKISFFSRIKFYLKKKKKKKIELKKAILKMKLS